jgi:thioredoxin-dependent peroxiredoxin
MKERKGIVTMHGMPITLLGDEVKVGDPAPDVTLVDNNMGAFKISSLMGKVAVLSAVPSLDTPVCNLETIRFNEEATKLSEDVEIITVSMDLPFAQKRWCAAEGVTRVKTYSDHRDAEFGAKYGVLIKELRLLARAVFVVDRKGIVRYVEMLDDIGKEPRYDDVVAAVKKLV